ncbi:pyridoxal phosphate-dependent aminotransferase [Gudongella oleilytica]|uniref:pyridoxal phosphate-dependent aminotransferase n=1 Tax=Gudongella oleilytica TaxID=1582259 RepID=UPI000FF8ABBE|nr:pyridoxal phosphate-dependent aminotransferase [Gudongella oleilytica]
MYISERLQSMQWSPIRKLTPIAQATKKRGVKVYHLNVGQPDIDTPEGFFKALREYEGKIVDYPLSEGIPELREATAEYYRKCGLDFSSEEVIITTGGSEALLFAIMTVADFGDELIAPEPYYTNYNGISTPIGVNIKPFLTVAENGFKLPAKEEIVKLIGPKTRAILVSNPGNPTGAVYSREEIEMLGEIAKKYGLFVIADEVYREFCYDGLEFISFASIPGIEENVIIIDSISKRFSACGARIGSVATKNKRVLESVSKLAQARASGPKMDQIGAVALYKSTPDSYFQEVNREYQNRRDILYKAIKEIPGVVCELPRGAFYVIVKFPVDDVEKFIIWMLGEFEDNGETVMMAPVASFYGSEGHGKDEARIAYVLKGEDLKRAMEIVKKALKVYQKKFMK